ncbi:hypothetical protein THAOC_08903 [Thalassiosira oceanica]|uniref:Ubiquitin-like protease family profile domain-containing protein n=1 Tax=Thalassiosira oceanica TaxID=159749 RepID=K0TH72_THAOC|nr:hypothetical protein THAOC_08903 [Thalassiosira oceanica]|eukprot:EJK69802.1 hypothetical protein THAOC_08903 [Thalassiosira oceanica]
MIDGDRQIREQSGDGLGSIDSTKAVVLSRDSRVSREPEPRRRIRSKSARPKPCSSGNQKTAKKSLNERLSEILSSEASRLNQMQAEAKGNVQMHPTQWLNRVNPNDGDNLRRANAVVREIRYGLNVKWQEKVNACIYGNRPDDSIIVWANKRQDTIQQQSFKTLQPGTWLNDEIINFYLKIVLTRRDKCELCKNDSQRRRSHAYSSYFVQTLFQLGDVIDHKVFGVYKFDGVKTWARRVPGQTSSNSSICFVP